ncbi:MAG: signal peptidase I [Clostridia bacterium]|nr:signal peptidase I [Clostridia bacterium]
MSKKMKSSKKNEKKQEEMEKPSFSFCVYDWAKTIITMLVFVMLILTFVFRQVTVSGPSMNDTLHNADRLIITNFMYQPHNGDIIIASHGDFYEDAIVKRVIATQGQKIRIDYENSKVYVNGKELDEPYAKGKTIMLSDMLDIPDVIPEGYVFVMGDNRENSVDSRSREIGLIPVQNIIGKAIFRVYPFDTFGGLT